jgi:glycosyltransferase involved in cell wall biosynthesis
MVNAPDITGPAEGAPASSIDMRIRVLLVAGSFPPMKCGIGDYSARLASSLAAEGSLTVAVLTDERAAPAPTDRGYEVFTVARGWALADIPRLLKVVSAWRPGIIHLQYPTQGYGSSLLPWVLPTLFTSMGIRVVLTWHEYWMGRWRFLPNALSLRGLVLIRPGHLDRMPRFYRKLLAHKRIKEIPNATVLPQVLLDSYERSSIRGKYGQPGKRLVVYFGFAYPAKGIEQLFQIADPARDHLVLACDLGSADPYQREIRALLADPRWTADASNPGFLPSDEAARLLAAADAVVLPFREGGGKWNSSVHAAVEQGTFVLTTSTEAHGYSPQENSYLARPGEIDEMRQALGRYIGIRNPSPRDVGSGMWKAIAEAHRTLYQELLSSRNSRTGG